MNVNKWANPSRNENYKVGQFVYLIHSPKYLHWQHWINEVYWNRTGAIKTVERILKCEEWSVRKTVAHVLAYQILSSSALVFVSFWRQMPVTCMSICMRLATFFYTLYEYNHNANLLTSTFDEATSICPTVGINILIIFCHLLIMCKVEFD